MSLFDLPRAADLPRLRSVTDRNILDRVRRLERALAAWQGEARSFARTTAALQSAADDLFRAANNTQDYGRSMPRDQAAEREELVEAVAKLCEHLAKFG
jgi:hypothetical protein